MAVSDPSNLLAPFVLTSTRRVLVEKRLDLGRLGRDKGCLAGASISPGCWHRRYCRLKK